tara:strand:+ start:575 stop:844 length:270 start_codon:yes stop_codon:yes gene_type:complete
VEVVVQEETITEQLEDLVVEEDLLYLAMEMVEQEHQVKDMLVVTEIIQTMEAAVAAVLVLLVLTLQVVATLLEVVVLDFGQVLLVQLIK